MIYLFIVLIIWYSISHPKKGVLNCGLFGGSFNREIDDSILQKLKILGLFNQTRGKDSCGYFNGSEIVKGVDKEKEFVDFVINGNVRVGKGNVFIGHTRNATHGVHSFANAHPFRVDKEGDEENSIILAHNGVIKNIHDLARDVDIKSSDFIVDSQGLLMLINKSGFSVLEKYKGFAAILYHDTSDPDSLLVYHGYSREWSIDKEAKEERPLFMLFAEEGVYFSSLKDSLKWINGGDDKDKIKVVPHNAVLKFTKGERIMDFLIKIDREKIHEKVEQYPIIIRPNKETLQREIEARRLGTKGLDIHAETYPGRNFLNDGAAVYYHKLRYWNNNGKLLDGEIYINKQGKIVMDSSQPRVALFHFFKGVLIKTPKEYRFIKEELLDPKSKLVRTLESSTEDFAKYLSYVSRYPIVNINDETISGLKNICWLSGNPANIGSIRPLFSERNYFFKDGVLTKITSGDEKEAPFLFEKKPDLPEPQQANYETFKASTLPSEAFSDYTKEVVDGAKVFRKIYTSYSDAEKAFGGELWFALLQYAEDVAKLLLGQKDPSDYLIDKIVEELLLSAVYTGQTVEDLMDKQLRNPESYVFDAFAAWEEGNMEDEDKDKKALAGIKTPKELEDETKYGCIEGTPEKDGQIQYEIDNEQTKAEETDEAIDRAKDVLQSCKEMLREVEELRMLASSDFALDVSKDIEMFAESIKLAIKDCAMKHKLTELSFYVSSQLKEHNII